MVKNRIKHIDNKVSREYLELVPKEMRNYLVGKHLFDDVFLNFQKFFRPLVYGNNFMYHVVDGLKPRFFNSSKTEVIYDEEEEVLEMYFI